MYGQAGNKRGLYSKCTAKPMDKKCTSKQVQALKDTIVPARKAAMIPSAVEWSKQCHGPILLEDCCNSFDNMGLEMERSLFEPNKSGKAILNTSGFTGKISEGTVVGEAIEVHPINYKAGTSVIAMLVMSAELDK